MFVCLLKMKARHDLFRVREAIFKGQKLSEKEPSMSFLGGLNLIWGVPGSSGSFLYLKTLHST